MCNENEVVFRFDDYGFWVSEKHPMNNFKEILRTGEAEIHFTNADNNNEYDWNRVTISKDLQIFGKRLLTTQKEMSIRDFSTIFNSKKWRYEIIYEYYSQNGAIFTGIISAPPRYCWTYGCQIELKYKDREYRWNKIYEDRKM
jgi:hypothetical protein